MRDSSHTIPRPGLKGNRSHHEVIGCVKWNRPGDETTAREVEVRICCQPERRQPPPNRKMKPTDYDHNTDCHPFWHIRRSNSVGDFNCEVVGGDIKLISSSSKKELQTDGNSPTPCVLGFSAIVPCIKNTEDIAPGDEIVLKWEKKAEAKETDKKRRVISAFTAGAPKKTKRT